MVFSSDSSEPKKVLVVEDERIIAINICSTLKQFGYQTEYVSDGESAIQKVDSDTFDLVLMDIMLGGGIDGIEVAKIVKKKQEIPVVYLTAYSDEATLDRAKKTEPFGYLIKPFNSRDLYVTAEMAIYKSQIQRQLREIQQKLAEAQKWETIGLVAAGISHEINNPLTSILNYSDLIVKETAAENNASLLSYAQKIANESERIAKIIKNLVQYSQATSEQNSEINVLEVFHDTCSFLHQYFLKENIQCEVFSETEIFLVGQAQKIKQIFLNLLLDARARVLNAKPSSESQIKLELVQANDKEIHLRLKDNGKTNPNLEFDHKESIQVTKIMVEELGGKINRIEEGSGGYWDLVLPSRSQKNSITVETRQN
ncbi:response regulator receiver domain protein [Leptospira ryugenii]|uniref:histidine kinase n=1 Tax=Leptospira ryugenii TaxID=1917863 RepID=A0A2P2DWW9_9LEPT|nr:response regulator [Leptospira ryugenii]GBF49123.1 response regulator receiver domain protein [Leptospira ryugenii]